MNIIKSVSQLVRNMGKKYVIFRIKHEIKTKLGFFKKTHPKNIRFNSPISLEEWNKSGVKFLISSKNELNIPKNPSESLKQSAEKILSGKIKFFSSDWVELGRDYDWITNPNTNYKYDILKHWSEISDMSKEAGDIKFVWEKSRFSYLLTLIRYDYHFEHDISEFVFSEIESWIDRNPINSGPNWRCSQEISLRIFNWCYALHYYKGSGALTSARWKKIQDVIYASLHHVYHHIDFSRIAVRNNHAITETLFLTLSEILFPFIPETQKWSKEGKKWFEQEINYQVYDDGTYLQFSMNYHRVVVQLLSFGLSIYHLSNKKFDSVVYKKAYLSLNFLYQCMQDENGRLPNYGSNDGAWFFPLSDTHYRDYRPQLNTLHRILTGEKLFNDRDCEEDYYWNGAQVIYEKKAVITKKQGVLSFDDGGFYLLRNQGFFTFIRCGSHKDRPAQADNLHIDIWYKGKNILRDSGSYKYNTDTEKLNYFMGSLSHNVVMVENHSQMLKGGRFIWYYWTQKIDAGWSETDTEFIFKGKIKAFQFLDKKSIYSRIISVSKTEPKWIVSDKIFHLDQLTKKQLWHPNDGRLIIKNSQHQKHKFKSYNSDFYGQYKEEESFYYNFKDSIKTEIIYKIN